MAPEILQKKRYYGRCVWRVCAHGLSMDHGVVRRWLLQAC